MTSRSDSQQRKKKKKKRTCRIEEFTIPAGRKVYLKEKMKRDKYLGLAIEHEGKL